MTTAQINDILRRTVEVASPSEHFGDPGPAITISDGAGGTFTGVLAGRTPHADSTGGLAFFWHDDQFVGWDSDVEAMTERTIGTTGRPGTFVITYDDYAAGDPICCNGPPTVLITFRWNGHAFAATTPIPPGVYGLGGRGTHAIRVRLESPGRAAPAKFVHFGGASLSLPTGWSGTSVPDVGPPTWCLGPASQPVPAKGDTTLCPATLVAIPNGSAGVQLSPDTTGGMVGNPQWCGQVPGSAVTWRLLDYRDKTFGGRTADYRRWTITCAGDHKTWQLEQYVVDSAPAYVVYSARADTRVHAVLSELAADSVLPQSTGGLRYSDAGRVLSIDRGAAGYHISLERLVDDQGSGRYVDAGGPYRYLVRAAAIDSAEHGQRLRVGDRITLTTNGHTVTHLYVTS